jgi:hypothetical protein
MRGPHNNEMKPTSHGPVGGSRLISVLSRRQPPMTEPTIVEQRRVVDWAALRAAPSLLADALSRGEQGSSLATNKSGYGGGSQRSALEAANSLVDSLPNDSGRTTGRDNNEMKPTRSEHPRWRPLRLISVLGWLKSGE